MNLAADLQEDDDCAGLSTGVLRNTDSFFTFACVSNPVPVRGNIRGCQRSSRERWGSGTVVAGRITLDLTAAEASEDLYLDRLENSWPSGPLNGWLVGGSVPGLRPKPFRLQDPDRSYPRLDQTSLKHPSTKSGRYTRDRTRIVEQRGPFHPRSWTNGGHINFAIRLI